MKPRPLTQKLNEFLADGLAHVIFDAINTHKLNDHGSALSLEPDSKIPMINSNGISASEYIALLDNNSYSTVFNDGAISIIQAKFKNQKLHSHRYIFIPCPLDQQFISNRPNDIPLSDWVKEVINTEGITSLKSTGYIRFDCVRDLQKTKDPHPVSHMTFSSGDCRVPVHSPLSISAFFNFLFDNFYRRHRYLWLKHSSFLNCEGTEDTITLEEQMIHHIHCMRD